MRYAVVIEKEGISYGLADMRARGEPIPQPSTCVEALDTGVRP